MKIPRAAMVCAVIAMLAAPGEADEFPNPLIKVEIVALSPAVDGVEAHVYPSKLAHLAPQVELSNTTPYEVLLMGVGGEPFMRVGPGGVFGNLRSATWVRSYDPTGRTKVSPGGPGPSWRQYARTPKWHWYEPRAEFRGAVPLPIATGRSVAVLKSWIVPGSYRGAPFSIEGRVIYRPVLGSIVARIVRVRPDRKGVRFRLIQSGSLPGIEIQNSSADVVEITGRDGAPFLRVGPNGVEANVNSATFKDTRPSSGSNGVGPSWKTIQQTPIFLWVERRAAYANPEPPEDIVKAGKRAKLLEWSVPGSIGGKALRIDGVTEWVPRHGGAEQTRSGSRPPVLAVVLAALAVIAAAVVFVRARRRTG